MKVFLYIRVASADQLAAADQREELERYRRTRARVAAAGGGGRHLRRPYGSVMNFLLNEAKRRDIGTVLTRDT